MIDFHAHILPGIDDGSKSVDESMTMLDSMSKQGIKKVIATPHFFANYESVDSFIERRKTAFQFLEERPPNSPEILLGAEVKYYDGISHLLDLKKLRIEGSRLLLFEMPFNRCKFILISPLLFGISLFKRHHLAVFILNTNIIKGTFKLSSDTA